jgi:hypothetical protein
MGISPKFLPCDGCCLPASPQHIAERLRRLELSTRFRPVHISVLFVALAPLVRPEDDFYGPAESREFADPFLEALSISSATDDSRHESNAGAAHFARLAEFQRQGYYLAYLSECPLPENKETVAATVARLAPTLIRRIRFNYKPKHIAPVGQELLSLADLLRQASLGPMLMLERGATLPTPTTGSREWIDAFRRAVSSVASRENPPSGYDRLEVRREKRDLGVGGST